MYVPGSIGMSVYTSYSRNPTISPLPLEKDSNQYDTHSTPRKMGFQI